MNFRLLAIFAVLLISASTEVAGFLGFFGNFVYFDFQSIFLLINFFANIQTFTCYFIEGQKCKDSTECKGFCSDDSLRYCDYGKNCRCQKK